jgi:hypothetical protein
MNQHEADSKQLLLQVGLLLFSGPKDEEICSSEMAVDYQRTTLRCIPEEFWFQINDKKETY